MAGSSRSSPRVPSPDVPAPNAAQVTRSGTGRIRRPHHKSRTGCRECKARRVKCDEKQPGCGSCNRKRIECHYFHPVCSLNNEPIGRIKIDPIRRALQEKPSLRLPIRSGNSIQKSSSPLLSDPQMMSSTLDLEHLPITVGTPVNRRLELRIFHHYQKMTSYASYGQQAWSKWIGNLAVATPDVMNAVLGFSAFHLRRQVGEDDMEVREASHRYMALAIRSHAEEIARGFGEDNAATLIACGALILFHTSVNQSFISGKAGHQLPMHWFRPFQTAAVFFNLTRHQIDKTPIAKILDSFLATVPPPRIVRALPFPNFDFLLEGLESEGLIEAVVEAYENAVTYLSEIYHLGYQKPLRFPSEVSARFVDLVEAGAPRALAIIGYFFMLVKIAKVLWWVDGAAEREFAAIMTFLPKDWWPIMNWAIKEFNWSEN